MGYSAKDFEDFVGGKTTGAVDSTPLGGFFYNPADDKAKAQAGLSGAQQAYGGLKPPAFNDVIFQGPQRAPDATSYQAGPSAMGTATPNATGRNAQTAQIAALQQLQARGGRTAASDANLAAIQQSENQNARAQRDAAMQSAAQRGMSGSGASLLASLDAGQNAVTRQSAQDAAVAGQEQNTALNAGMGAAQLGSNLEGQDFAEQASKAQAQDAVNRFNAGNNTQVSEFNTNKNQGVNDKTAAALNQGQVINNVEEPQMTYGDSLERAKGMSAADLAQTKYYTDQQKMNMAKQGGLWQGAAQMGMSALGSGGLGSLFGGGAAGGTGLGVEGLAGGGGGALAGGLTSTGSDTGDFLGGGTSTADYLGSGGGDMTTWGTGAADAADEAAPVAEDAGEAALSTGGRIPGVAPVRGDSPFNDFMKVKTSPGEVVVPRSLALSGTKQQIGEFVQKAPTIAPPNPNRDKEAVLGALRNIRMKGRAA